MFCVSDCLEDEIIPRSSLGNDPAFRHSRVTINDYSLTSWEGWWRWPPPAILSGHSAVLCAHFKTGDRDGKQITKLWYQISFPSVSLLFSFLDVFSARQQCWLTCLAREWRDWRWRRWRQCSLWTSKSGTLPDRTSILTWTNNYGYYAWKLFEEFV